MVLTPVGGSNPEYGRPRLIAVAWGDTPTAELDAEPRPVSTAKQSNQTNNSSQNKNMCQHKQESQMPILFFHKLKKKNMH